MLFLAFAGGVVSRVGRQHPTSLTSSRHRDDDYITETRYLQQPEGMTSVITGFNASIRIHCRE
jgi:hypothetical protein